MRVMKQVLLVVFFKFQSLGKTEWMIQQWINLIPHLKHKKIKTYIFCLKKGIASESSRNKNKLRKMFLAYLSIRGHRGPIGKCSIRGQTVLSLHLSNQGGLCNRTQFIGRKEMCNDHKVDFSNSYIFRTWWCKPLIFQAFTFLSNIIYSLKYQSSTTPSYRDKGIRKYILLRISFNSFAQ